MDGVRHEGLKSPLEEVHRPLNLVADEFLQQMSPHLPQEVVGRGVRRVAGEHTYAVHLRHDEAESCQSLDLALLQQSPAVNQDSLEESSSGLRKGKRYYHRSPRRSGRTCCSGGTQVGRREPPPKPGRETAEIYAHSRNHD